MIMLSDVGGISGVRSTLNTVNVPPDVIEEIVAIIESTSGDLKSDSLQPVTGTWFGDSSSGQTLGIHTDKAHLKLSNAVLEAVSGLQATGEAMETFNKEISQADADSDEVARVLLHRTQTAIDSMDGDRHTPPTPSGSTGSDH